MPRVTHAPTHFACARRTKLTSIFIGTEDLILPVADQRVSRTLPPQHGRTADRQDRNRPTRLRTNSRTDQICRHYDDRLLEHWAEWLAAQMRRERQIFCPLQQGRPPVNAPRDAHPSSACDRAGVWRPKPADITTLAPERRSLSSSAGTGSSGLDIPQSLAPIKKTGRR